MNGKQRVLTAFAHEEPDRVPVDYIANPEIDEGLRRHFGLTADDPEGLLRALGVDFRCVGAPYVGPPLHAPLPDRQTDLWGIRRRWIAHDSGGYWDYCDFPLRDATVEQAAAWPMPDPDAFDYARAAAESRRLAEYCVVAGSPGLGDVINKSGMLGGHEWALMSLALDDPAFALLNDRRLAVEREVTRRTLEAAGGAIDLLWIGEDLGTQRGATISVEMFRRQIRPRLQPLVDLGRQFGIPVMIHSCGSSSWAFEDFVEMGISVVDTLQPEAKDMSPGELKRRFGDHLSFHGMISTAGPVAYGGVADVVADVRETLKVMKPGGGYALAPTHRLQANSPIENVVAMYEAAREWGRY
jgi:uroporphyrinogen decarboxylase